MLSLSIRRNPIQHDHSIDAMHSQISTNEVQSTWNQNPSNSQATIVSHILSTLLDSIQSQTITVYEIFNA